MLSFGDRAHGRGRFNPLWLCLLLLICLLANPVRQTAAYITAESVTCVNTFSGDTGTEQPDDSSRPQEPSEPDQPGESDQPSQPQEPGESGRPDQTSRPELPGHGEANPPTGQGSISGAWMVLAAAGLGAVLLVTLKKSGKKNG